ncbi:MAG TPA: molybdopterin-synthase adenylyltransferase MoeB [Bacteroidota bacterium]|nr:molybdopterin-synthase adenylyltransferase MoeB [Bacteroidota bacterium]
MKQSQRSPEELSRYSRQLVLPEVGNAGQAKIENARVLIVGVGGLGSPAALYLAAVGVGTIGLIDDDTVALSNLHRQIVHTTASIGRPKVESARDRMLELNPHVRVDCHATRLSPTNALELIERYDIIIDGSDNFVTRYLINDACVFLAKRHIHGSVYKFEGTVSVFGRDGPCYRCVHPVAPLPLLVQDCAQSGVLGVVPGLIGVMQATETLKLILGIGQPLVGRVLMVDSLTMTTREHLVLKNVDCPICGNHPTILTLTDEGQTCRAPDCNHAPSLKERLADMRVEELKQKLERKETFTLLDVREPEEFDIANLGGRLIPLGELRDRLGELDREAEIVVFCHHGIRSRSAVALMQQCGFANVKNLVGGIDAWSRLIDPTLPRY